MKMIEQTCEQCGQGFQKPWRARHCSTACRKDSTGKTERPCEQCGVVFRPTRKADAGRFCSKQCDNDSRGSGYVDATCMYCGVDFVGRKDTSVKSARSTFCSRACFFAAQREGQIEKALPTPTEKECTVCGRAFLGGWSAMFCSDTCKSDKVRGEKLSSYDPQDRAFDCRECKTRVLPEYGDTRRVFCSKECHEAAQNRLKNRTGNHRKRARIYGVEYETIDPIKVFARDRWICRLCGTRTLKSKRGTAHDRAPELDHIVPMSKGGAHVHGNVQCACRKCNGSKGATIAGQLSLLAHQVAA